MAWCRQEGVRESKLSSYSWEEVGTIQAQRKRWALVNTRMRINNEGIRRDS